MSNLFNFTLYRPITMNINPFVYLLIIKILFQKFIPKLIGKTLRDIYTILCY
jgi:hypothetical protein